MAQNYSLRFRTLEGKEGKELPIVSKNYFYNESFKIPLIPWSEGKPEREDSRIIFIEIVRKGAEEVELVGKFQYGHYHKDKAYKAVVNLIPVNKHNKGETVLNFSFCLKSTLYNKKKEPINYVNLEQFYSKVFDYDIGP